MPIVVRIATHEAAISSNSITRSTRLRARNSGRTRRYAQREHRGCRARRRPRSRACDSCRAARCSARAAARRRRLAARRDDVAARRGCECRCRTSPSWSSGRACIDAGSESSSASCATRRRSNDVPQHEQRERRQARTRAPRSRRDSPAANGRYAARRLPPRRRRAAGRGSNRAARDRRRRTAVSMKPRSAIVVGARAWLIVHRQ